MTLPFQAIPGGVGGGVVEVAGTGAIHSGGSALPQELCCPGPCHCIGLQSTDRLFGALA